MAAAPETLHNLDSVLDTLPDAEHLSDAGIEIEPADGHKVPLKKVIPISDTHGDGADRYKVIEEIPLKPLERYVQHFPGQAALASAVFLIEPLGARVPALAELASKIDSMETQEDAVSLIKGSVDILTAEEIQKVLSTLPQENPKVESATEAISDKELVFQAYEIFDDGNGDLLETLQILDKVQDIHKRDGALQEVSIRLGQLNLFNESRKVAEKVTDTQLKGDLFDVINRLDHATPAEIEAHTESSSEVIKKRIGLAIDYIKTLATGGRMLAIPNLIRDLEGANSLEYAREVVEYAPRITEEERNKILEILNGGEVVGATVETNDDLAAGAVEINKLEKEEEQEDLNDPALASAIVIPISAGNPASPEAGAVKTPEELQEEINAELLAARSEYATQLTEFRNKKGKLDKLRAQLGVSKQTPESEWPEELKQAEKRYIEAKKKKREAVIGKDQIYGYEDKKTKEVKNQFVFNPDIVKEAEEEYASLQKELADLTPEKQKGIMGKALQKWTSLSPAKRIAVSTAIMTAGGLAAGTFGLAGAAGYAGYRVARAGLGMLTSQGMGKAMDVAQSRKNERLTKDTLKEYGTEINLENFEEKERELMRELEKIENIKKRQRLYKAGAMVATGVATYGLTGSATEHLAPGLKTSTGIVGAVKRSFVGERLTDKELMHPTNLKVGHNLEAAHPVAPDAEKLFEKDAYKVNTELAEKINIPKPESLEPAPVNIEVSSHGFIGTFNDLKKKLIEQYGEGKVPKQYEHFVNTPSEKLAQEFGFYKPGEDLQSGMSFKGETFDLNAKGQLEYHQLDGHTAVIDADHKFSGKMFNAEEQPEASAAEAETHTSIEHAEPGDETSGVDRNFDTVEDPDAPHADPEIEPNPKLAYIDEQNTESEHIYSKSDAALESHAAPAPVHEAGVTESYPSEIDTGDVTAEPLPAMNAPETIFPPHPGDALLDHPRAPLLTTQIEAGDKVGYIETSPAGGRVLELRGVGQIAHEHQFGTGAGKIFTLDDKFQEGEKFADVRKVFNALNDKIVKPEQIGKMVYPLNFEGGKVMVIHGDVGGYPDAVHVLLNGKEIGAGTVDEVGLKVEYTGPKSSLLLPKNAYEQAFKHVQPLLKTLKQQAFDKRMAQFAKDTAMAKVK